MPSANLDADKCIFTKAC